ncbi:hypothetical protein RFI_30641 [Reticulomyxa filosa]|uniref:PX domain-containing protein n=1 Tax=Reticulomyxa filosa TaxID=46433 RepID=X6LZG8_RETFI|nr:hypothetical protein RFI_30641 [Reticulomyxa filosa]|eukprot:ETO06751.1 hypothetical protein RFI_30641 [Reticulomyxa filosa]
MALFLIISKTKDNTKDSSSNEVDEQSKEEPPTIITSPTKVTTTQTIPFEATFPFVKRITIKGGFFNKESYDNKKKCEIAYENVAFEREIKYFKWLWRMLLLFVGGKLCVPDFPNDLPESHWPEGYLKRRRKELNLFLMQCHCIQWIRDSEVYSIFLTTDSKLFDLKRKNWDKYCIQQFKAR